MGTKAIPSDAVEVSPGGAFRPSSFGSGVKIVGQIHSQEDLHIDGDLDGTVEALDYTITIGPKGVVHANVRAREVIILGTFQGNVEAADRIEIHKDAKLVGDVRTARITIEDGAYFKGSIDIILTPRAKIALLGSQQAEAADARAEHEIKAGKYTTVSDPKGIENMLGTERGLNAGGVEQQTTSVSWSSR